MQRLPASNNRAYIMPSLPAAEHRAPETARLLAHANGHLDFLSAPEMFETDVFDLWAVSLLKFILPRLDPGPNR